VQSEEAVLRYVTSTKGAIGYVDACSLDRRVKAMLWIANDKIMTAAPEKFNCPNMP
jgi:ABC-type phosphate transport system substrate-binding protein